MVLFSKQDDSYVYVQPTTPAEDIVGQQGAGMVVGIVLGVLIPVVLGLLGTWLVVEILNKKRQVKEMQKNFRKDTIILNTDWW